MDDDVAEVDAPRSRRETMRIAARYGLYFLLFCVVYGVLGWLIIIVIAD